MATPLHPGEELADEKPGSNESIVLRTLKARRDEIAQDREGMVQRLEREREELASQQNDYDHIDGVLAALDVEADDIDRAIAKLEEPANTTQPLASMLSSVGSLASPSWEPEPDSDGHLSLEGAITQAIGAGSVCWGGWGDDGVFQDQHAIAVKDGLLRWIVDRFQTIPDPGSYTTEVGGQVFTQAQWEAVLVWRKGTTGEAANAEPPVKVPAMEGTYSPHSLLRDTLRKMGFGGISSEALSHDMLRTERVGDDLVHILTLGLIADQREKGTTYVVVRKELDPVTMFPVTTQVGLEEALDFWRDLSSRAAGRHGRTFHVVDVIA